jgi:hypothetical protein
MAHKLFASNAPPPIYTMPVTTAKALELAFFTDVEQFRAIALPILESDTTSNTLALSALLSITEPKPGVVLGLLTSSNSSIVLVSPGYQGIGCQLYVAPAPDNEESATLIAQQLSNLPCTTISTTAAGAALLQQYCGWQEKHRMNIMVFQPETNAAEHTATPATTAGTVLPTAAAAPNTEVGDSTPTTAAAAAAAARQSAHSSSSSSSAFSSRADVQLRSCCADNPADVQLAMQWAGEFLAQVFHLPSAPALPQLQDMVLPRLQRGLYHVLCDSAPADTAAAAAAAPAAAAPVCMACHVPTSSDSTRITMLYTPTEKRGRGYGRQTSELQLVRMKGGGGAWCCWLSQAGWRQQYDVRQQYTTAGATHGDPSVCPRSGAVARQS